ncbi:hypothetical protein [Streptomyces sp. NBC_01589]|uniref:hypothetical protein n=1 Tax=unclassified Streptomyces TaxID=2593676 RepID=UPI00386E34A0
MTRALTAEAVTCLTGDGCHVKVITIQTGDAPGWSTWGERERHHSKALDIPVAIEATVA